MKKILSIVAVLFISTSLFAQSQEVSEKSATKANASIKKMVKDVAKLKSPDAFQAYVNKNFTTNDMDQPSAKFNNFIEQTVRSKASYDVKKMAIYMRYGEVNYEAHMEDIKLSQEKINRE